MIKGFNKSKLIERFLNLKNVLNKRSIKTTVFKRGGNAAGEHHHHEAKQEFSFFRIREPEHPKLHQGYVYREPANLQGATNTTLARILITAAWWWVFYNIWKHPAETFGHMPYPDTSKWTNAELGIPNDDEE